MSVATRKEPQQARSRESFERVIAAATRILEDAGYDGLTLQEVSRSSGVSIGSIYGRVSGKDELMRVVQERALQTMQAEQDEMLSPERWREYRLEELVPALVNELAEFLRSRAALLRAFMSRASADEVIGAAGRAAAARSADAVKQLLLLRRPEITHPDPERAVAACYTTIYAVFSRYLGLGTSLEAAGGGVWQDIKQDVALMCVCFLKSNVDATRSKR